MRALTDMPCRSASAINAACSSTSKCARTPDGSRSAIGLCGVRYQRAYKHRKEVMPS